MRYLNCRSARHDRISAWKELMVESMENMSARVRPLLKCLVASRGERSIAVLCHKFTVLILMSLHRCPAYSTHHNIRQHLCHPYHHLLSRYRTKLPQNQNSPHSLHHISTIPRPPPYQRLFASLPPSSPPPKSSTFLFPIAFSDITTSALPVSETVMPTAVALV